MASLDLIDIYKSYGKTEVIHGIDMHIESGEFCVFVGPSGCGKSTLLRMIAGLEPITAGDVRIEGEVVNNISAANRGLAMVFQSYALYPHMSVRNNLSFGLENLNMPRAEIKQRVEKASRMLQIDSLMKRKPGQLSGGQRQRVAIGRAVVREPKIFLFDEPLSNLDAELRVAMRAEIAALHQRLGNTMVYVTHDQVEAMTMADKIAVLRDGKLEQFGRPLDLYNLPANRFVAGFIGTPRMNFFDATVQSQGTSLELATPDGSLVEVPGDRFQQIQAENVTVGIRANHLTVCDAEAGDLSLQVASTEQLGGETYVYGTVEETGSSMTLHLPGQANINRGERVGLQMSADSCHVFDGETGASLLAG